MIYFVSDLHIGHKNILDFEAHRGARWSSVEDMTEGIIEDWNKLITKDDIVYNLGDFLFNIKPRYVEDIVKRLNFKEMVLIAGNHDHSKVIKKYQELGIRVVYADMIKRNGRRYYLSHYPTLIDRKGVFNIHGHIHSKDMDTNYHINVGMDNTQKIALSFDDIEEIASKLEEKNKKV